MTFFFGSKYSSFNNNFDSFNNKFSSLFNNKYSYFDSHTYKSYCSYSNAPKIISNGGDSCVTVCIDENTTFVTDVETWDKFSTEENGKLQYSIAGGYDADLFTIDEKTGVLSFKEAPDFEMPTDSNENGIYSVKVKVTDAAGYTDTQWINVKVKDVVEEEPELGSIGDQVFFDNRRRDSLQDGDEAGVEGVKVTLTGAGKDGEFGTADDTTAMTRTDADGKYNFTDLLPGDYKVTFSELPDGYVFVEKDAGDDALDSDADPATGMTDVISLNPGEHLTSVDAGIRAGLIGDQVFFDENRNGIRDRGVNGSSSELGVEGVNIHLQGAGRDGLFDTSDDIFDTTTTNRNGGYSFGDVLPGDYKLTFELPAGYEFTTQGAGGNFDSDVDPATGMTGVVTVAPGQLIFNVDAGLVLA